MLRLSEIGTYLVTDLPVTQFLCFGACGLSHGLAPEQCCEYLPREMEVLWGSGTALQGRRLRL